jgi:subtilisin family serine protease
MLRPEDPDDPGTGHYIDGVIALSSEPDHVEAALGLDGAFELDDERVAQLLAGMSADEAGQVQEMVALVGVADPHVASAALRDREIPASPIHGVGYESHRGFMAGTDPRDARLPLPPPETEADPERVVAVVDSGIVADDFLPEWMRGGSVIRDETDIEVLDKRETSHGTFVTSIIRQVHPDAVVSIAAAHPDTRGLLVTDEPDHQDAPHPTTELDVLGAVLRLINRHSASPETVMALNLSLGTTRLLDNDAYLLVLAIAIDHWRAHFGRNAVIFAAGGNSGDPRPVYPAAFDCVRGVGAATDGGVETVWDREAEIAPPSRPWVDDVAPGVSLVGLSGRDPEHTVKWSGSSFATAVATASHVKGAPYQVADGMVWWPNRSVPYANVAGLQYV